MDLFSVDVISVDLFSYNHQGDLSLLLITVPQMMEEHTYNN